MQFMSEQGQKHPQDVKTYVRTDGWEPTRFTDMAEWVRRLYRNEEVLYPKREGFLGGDMLLDFICESARSNEPIDVIARRFKL